MAMERMQALKAILAANPGDKLARYGLAMEQIKAGELEEAVAQFRALVQADPDYLYAYFHAGQTLEKLGRNGEAAEMYRRGVEAAARKQDKHAEQELQAALDAISP